MLIGVPKEIKGHEYRVGLVPSSVRELVKYDYKDMNFIDSPIQTLLPFLLCCGVVSISHRWVIAQKNNSGQLILSGFLMTRTVHVVVK